MNCSQAKLTVARNEKTGKQDITQLQPNNEIVERYYHREASARVMEAFHTSKEKKVAFSDG